MKKIKKFHPFLITLLMIVAALLPTGEATGKRVKFNIMRGTNIAHWLSQSGARGSERQAFFTEADIARIVSWGFDHIRLPIDEEQMFRQDGSKDPEAFALLHNAIDSSLKHGLRVIVDMHILRAHYFNSKNNPLFTDPAAGRRFIEVWQALSGELHKYPLTKVAYELMNEPVADNDADWNKVYLPVYRAIRALEPNRVIVIGSNRWQAFDKVKYLELPEGDKNIIVSFHYYNPFALTHYRTSWTDMKDYKGPVHYPGTPMRADELQAEGSAIAKKYKWWSEPAQTYDRTRIYREMKEASDNVKAKGLRIYCGEFGAIWNSPLEERLRWFRDMISVMDELGIARASWCYKEDGFGLVDTGGKETCEEIRLMQTGRKK